MALLPPSHNDEQLVRLRSSNAAKGGVRAKLASTV